MENQTKQPKAYFIGGVNGVGKSTFLSEVSARHPEFQIVKSSSMFMGWLKLEPGDYDSLRALPDDYKRVEFDKMMNDLLSQSSTDGKIMLIDVHYFHYKQGEMIDTTGSWMSIFDALFVVTGDVEEVLKRIIKDNTKNRDLFPQGVSLDEQRILLKKYLIKTIEKAREVSEKYNIPLFIINNIQGDIDKAVNSFLNAHTEIIKIIKGQ